MVLGVLINRANKFVLSKSFIRYKSYFDSLNSPRFTIPMQINLSDFKCNESLYYNPNLNNPTKPKYILHDGPPYANGEPHVGHALNKVLKDVTIRSKLLEGYDVQFRPGWDCHGLPIELKATGSVDSKLSIGDTREKARSVALKYVNIQRERFKNWAILGDWENPYKTIDNEYQANQMQAFSKLFEKGIIVRDKYPVYWSYSTKTALAEAELEYNENHQSKSVFLKLKVNNCSSHLSGIMSDNNPLHLIIWTTTPWTLLSNEAVAAHPAIEYCVCHAEHGKNESFICATEFLPKLETFLGKPLTISTTFTGSALVGCEYKHPLLDKYCPLLNADYVTVDKGSGLVHVAPCHGKDDYYLGLLNDLPMNLLVDENACYTEDAGSDFRGLFTLKEGTDKVLSLLNGDVLHVENFTHSYPYDWRSKKPIIIRLSEQWFIDTNQLKDKVELACKDVRVFPANMKETLLKFSINRPRWCISRQRVWGVPIPVLFYKGEPVVDSHFISAISERVGKEGADFWWQESVENIVPQSLLERLKFDVRHLTKGEDIFDIWFDSGLSWLNVMPKSTCADLYLEGEDQFRGWFSSSLLLSVALTGKSPFKTIVSHGFTTDESGRKMSKSLGNVVDPDEVIRQYGVDVLRYWAATSGLGSNSIGPQILQQYFIKYKSIRNMFRFILGNLWDFSPDVGPISDGQDLHAIDRYILHEVSSFKSDCRRFYSEFQYDQVLPLFERISALISNFYLTAIKDRLYCNVGESRTSAQRTLYSLLCDTTLIISPILPVLCQEVQNHWPTGAHRPHLSWDEEVIHLDLNSSQLIKEAIEKVALPIRDGLSRSDRLIQLISQETKAANPFASLSIAIFPKSVAEESNLKRLQQQECSSYSSLCEILRCADTTVHSHLAESAPRRKDDILVNLCVGDVWVQRLDNACKCPRCRRYVKESADVNLCRRCESVLIDKQGSTQRKVA